MWARLRSAYAWVLLSIIMIPLFPVLLAVRWLTTPFDPRRDGLRRFVARWVSVYGHLTPLYRFELTGLEHLQGDEPYVLVANHESGLDTLCLLMLATPARFLVEDYLFALPVAGWLFRTTDQIAVKIGDRESGTRALEEAACSIAGGTPIAIFPEGHLSPDRMADFRPGAFVLAQRTGVRLVPVLLQGTGEAWRPGTMVVEGHHRIAIQVLEPIPADVVQASDPTELAARVRADLLVRKGEPEASCT